MKLSILAIGVLISLHSMAQYHSLDPARQAERDARDRAQSGGYLVPGYPPQYPTRPLPPPPAPAYDYYNYGPHYTVRWSDFGLSKFPKLITQSISIDVRGQLVNEILLRGAKSQVDIRSITAYLNNGQILNLNHLSGVIREGQEIRASLDYRYSLRVNRIVIEGNSPNLIGSLGQLSVILGLAE